MFFLFLCGNLYAQSHTQKKDSLEITITQIEDHLLSLRFDSALLVVKSVNTSSNYTNVLSRLCQPGMASYADYLAFIEAIKEREANNFRQLDKFIQHNVKMPDKTGEINMDFVYIKWLQIRNLANELLVLREASIQNDSLTKYISQFDKNAPDTKRAEILASTHEIIMAEIQGNIKVGKAICLKNEKTARAMNDTSMIILSLYHLSDFLQREGKLDEYIAVSEESYELDKLQAVKSPYYTGTLSHLINALVYKGGYDEQVIELLDEMYNAPGATTLSYNLYAQFLSTLPPDSPYKEIIYKKFEVNDLPGFCDKIMLLSENVLNLNDYYHVLRQSAKALANEGLYKDALNYQSRAVAVNKKVYSQELSENLANYETKLAVKEKELDVKHEQERSRLYLIIMSLTGFLLTVALFAFIRSQKQTKNLKIKNDFIAQQRDAIVKREAEKELLLREVNHRVKNNFQIILSLLEIQATDIQDPKALALTHEGKSRVKSMSLIHDSLYQNDDLNIPFDEYVKKLIAEISNMFTIEEQPQISIAPSTHSFDIDTAIPLGLIINELVTNAFKYGFDETKKLLSISVNQGNESGSYELKVTDNGRGIATDFDLATSKSTGLKLVQRLAKQLQGKIEYSYESGCSFLVSFKDTETRNRENDMALT
ncbi:sensor histidine kinase [Reichenbachiella sp. MALMAid0571]